MALTKIRYKGLSDERIMSKKDLGDAGFPMSDGLRWDRKNLWTQFVDSPSDEFLDMLKRDGNFTVSDAEAGEGEGKAILMADPAKADDTGRTVINKDETGGKDPAAAAAGKGK